jgi:hypothetical protein
MRTNEGAPGFNKEKNYDLIDNRPQETIHPNKNSLHNSTSNNRKETSPNENDRVLKDCILMNNGKMMLVMKNGNMTSLTEDMALSDGSLVLRNGTVIKKGGLRVTLIEGEYIDMTGRISQTKKMVSPSMKPISK